MARSGEAALHDRLEWDTPLFRTLLAHRDVSQQRESSLRTTSLVRGLNP